MAEFASNAKANTGIVLGSIGTGLSVLSPHLGNLFGGYNANGGYVSKEAFDLQKKISSQESEISLLKSEANTEVKIADVFERLSVRIKAIEDKESQRWSDQSVINAQMAASITTNQQSIAGLQATVGGITKTAVPRAAICDFGCGCGCGGNANI